jgi:uncharacterized protein (TIGR00255 family)
MPEMFKNRQEEPGPEEAEVILQTVGAAVDKVNLFRRREGEGLSKDISGRIQSIHACLMTIEPFEKNRVSRLKGKILKDLEGIKVTVDENRFEQEMIFYLEKLDITEEKTRLRQHLDYFMQVMEEDASNGRKLGFIAQEIGREVNTLGSKANDADIQKKVVEMKDELEKIKEQLLNIL